MVPGSVDEEFIDNIEKEYSIKVKRVYFDDTAMQDVVMGKIDACVQSQTIALEAIRRFGADKIKVLIGSGIYFESAYPFARTPEGDALREMTNRTLEANTNILPIILSNHLSLSVYIFNFLPMS